ncbi:spore germination protein [Bacillus sp. JZ8]
MPAIVGAVSVNSVGSASIFHIGDVYTIAPSANSKTFAGAGSFSTGDGLVINNKISSTNTQDQDFIDQPIAANA